MKSDSFDRPYCTACEARMQSVLHSIDGHELKTVNGAKACNIFKRGQVIFEAGTEPDGIFCLHSGKVKVYKTGEEGRDHIVRFAKSGDTLGYRSMLSGAPYAVSAAALEDCVVCLIPKTVILDLIQKNSRFATTVIQSLADTLARAEDQIVNLAQKPVRERLAEVLLLLREVYGTDNGDNGAIDVVLSRDELAAVVGTATETLVRTLGDFKRERLIATEKKRIHILDTQGLVRVSNLRD